VYVCMWDNARMMPELELGKCYEGGRGVVADVAESLLFLMHGVRTEDGDENVCVCVCVCVCKCAGNPRVVVKDLEELREA
jgi:hypothetical protein